MTTAAAARANKPQVLLIGAGGHAKALVDLLRAARWPEPAGALDDSPDPADVLGVPVLGTTAQLAALRPQGLAAVVVALGDNALRARFGAVARALGYALPTLVHPAATIAASARLGAGCVVLPLAVLGAEAVAGDLVILNTASVAEHDCVLEEAAHLAPGAILSGGVRVGARALVGVGAAVLPGIAIGADAVIGAGAAVTADVPPGARVAGVPAR